MLDARELARIALEQPRVAAAAAGGATAAHVRPAASGHAAPAAGEAGSVRPAAASLPAAGAAPAAAHPTTPGPTVAGRSAARPAANLAVPNPAAPAPAAPGPPAHEAAEPDEPLPASGTGAEDFRAVAPPIMSFAQGRRR
jgi:hypothetical protein